MLSGPRRGSTGIILAVAFAALTVILDKQESLRIPCVRYDAGGFSRAVNTTDGRQQKCAEASAIKAQEQMCPCLPDSRLAGKRIP